MGLLFSSLDFYSHVIYLSLSTRGSAKLPIYLVFLCKVNFIPFKNQYIRLGDAFYVKTRPASVANPSLIRFNEALAVELGIPVLDNEDVAGIFSGKVIPEGSEPVAMAYAGHQFGGFNPQLGDGRAILLGEVASPAGGHFDIHLKGSGPTAFSRNGDGLAALGPVLREYLVSEAMHKLGVPTTRALAAVTTGEEVVRERLLPGGVITRVARSFVRVGTFEYFAARGNTGEIRQLADFIIERAYPEAREAANPYVALLQGVVERQAELIAQWMNLGFIHGVMNTDNMAISGETIDYGPCAFMDGFDYNKVYSSIDRNGRYAYGNQASIGLWNLTRFAETLLPLFDENGDTAIEVAKQVLGVYVDHYQQVRQSGLLAKLGLLPGDAQTDAGDKKLIEALFDTMQASSADFTLTFYHLSRLSVQASENDEAIRRLFNHMPQFDDWLVQWREHLRRDAQDDTLRQAAMQAVNPVYIPRNHQVEAAIRAAEDRADFSVFHTLHEVLQQPYRYQPGRDRYMQPPEPHEVVEKTFCGT